MRLFAALALLFPLASFAQAPLRGDAQRGEQLFRMECASCHGADGGGSRFWNGAIAGTKFQQPPDLRNSAFLAVRNDDDLHRVIAEGHGQKGWIAGHALHSLSILDRWDIIQWLRDRSMTVAAFFPEAVQFTAKDFEIDKYGAERLEEIRVTVGEAERNVVVLTVYKGRKVAGAGGGVDLVPWNPVALDLLEAKDRLGFLTFVDVEVPRSAEKIHTGLAFSPQGKLLRVQVQHADPKAKAAYEKILSSFVGQGQRTASAYKAPANLRDGAAWAAALTRAAGIATEGIIMYDKAERSRTAFDR